MIAVAGYPPVPSSVSFAQQLPHKVCFWLPPCPLKPAQVYLGLQLVRLSFIHFLLACCLLVLYKGSSPILRVFLELFKSFLKAVFMMFCKTQHLEGRWTVSAPHSHAGKGFACPTWGEWCRDFQASVNASACVCSHSTAPHGEMNFLPVTAWMLSPLIGRGFLLYADFFFLGVAALLWDRNLLLIISFCDFLT